MPGPVAVEVAPAPPGPRLATLLEACRATAPSGECSASSDAVDPSAAAIVTWNAGETEARLRVGVRRGGVAHWAERTIAFAPTDPPLERWRTVGLAVGTLAGEAEDTAERARDEGGTAIAEAPRASPPPPPEPPPAPRPTPAAPATDAAWQTGVVVALTTRIPLEGRVAPGGWFGAEAAHGVVAARLTLGASWRAGPGTVDQTWWAAAAGAELRPWQAGFLRAGLRVTRWVAELEVGPDATSAAAWMPAVDLTVGTRWRLVPGLELEAALGGVLWLRAGTLRSAGEELGRHPAGEGDLTLGLGWAP